jgi:hypothetical protein
LRRLATLPVALAMAIASASCEPAGPPSSGVSTHSPETTWGAPQPPDVPPASVATVPPATDSGVPVSNAELVIRQQIHPGAKRCYQRGLDIDPTLVGRIVIFLRVDASGAVAESRVATILGMSQDVAECIASVARKAHFEPPGQDGAKISIPFNFERAPTPGPQAQ